MLQRCPVCEESVQGDWIHPECKAKMSKKRLDLLNILAGHREENLRSPEEDEVSDTPIPCWS